MKKRVSLEAQHDLIAQRLREGRLVKEIAPEVGTSPSSLAQYIRKHEIPRTTGRGRYNRTPNNACTRNHDTVKRMAEEGAPLDEIGRAVGTTKSRVREYLTRHNIQRPPWREPSGSHPMSRATGGHLNPSWRGGRHQDKSGYWLLWMPDHPEANRHGQVREHRIVAEQHLGRPLTPREVVDHIDGDCSNNDPANLRVFPDNGTHLRATLSRPGPRREAALRTAIPLVSASGDQRSP